MSIDLHIHSNFSDGRMNIEQIISEALRRGITFFSITDHDSIEGQEGAQFLANKYRIQYVSGLELNILFTHPEYIDSKPVSLDLLAYQYNIRYLPLIEKIASLVDCRKKRAEKILKKVNLELKHENIPEFSDDDFEEIRNSVNGVFGRPHIADYMIKKGIVSDRQRAFEKYLIKCDVPKMPLSLEEASELIKGAGGKLILAHPNNPRGTSLVALTTDITEQEQIIKKFMVKYIDGLECWHPSHDKKTTESYLAFAANSNLMVTGGSDCHQRPILMGNVRVPSYVAQQFGINL
jgi:3',5'-nucleoside bisphosphate phosphatase